MEISLKDLIKKNKPSPPSKFIIMGDPLTGKTTLAAKAPKPLFVSTDGNAAKAGLDAVSAESLEIVRQVITSFATDPNYETLVIDTIEGIADLFEKSLIDKYNQENGTKISALSDVSFGRLIGQYNRRIAAFSETLYNLKKNVIIITYAKRQIDEINKSIVLTSELKSIRQFTRFADGIILTTYDGDKYSARATAKRTVVNSDSDNGSIEPFLKAAGWGLPQRKVKLGDTK